MFAVLSCLQKHDPHLVFWAAAICVVGSAASLSAYRKALLGDGVLRASWLAIMSVLLGCAVWATHFMAMLAYQPGLEVHFEFGGTFLSLCLAVAGFAAGGTIAIFKPDNLGRALGGAVFGAAIAVMHFTGVAAMRLPADLVWNPGLVGAAVMQAVLLGGAALVAAGDLFKLRRGLLATVLLVSAICGLHFTAMSAVTLIPNGAPLVVSQSRQGLALGLGALAAVVLVAGCGVIMLEQFGKISVLAGLRSALGKSSSAIAFFDRNHRLIFWNDSYGSVLQTYEMVARRGARLEDILGSAARRGLPIQVAESAATNMSLRPRSAETGDFQTSDGRWFQSNMASTQDGGLVIVLTDVTERLALVEREAAARRQAEEASQAKSDFLANMSHEIRTPLNGVLGMVQVLGRQPLEPEQRECLDVIERSGAALLSIVNHALDLAKFESGKLELEVASFDLEDVVRSACCPYSAIAEDKSLTLDIRIAPDASGGWVGDGARLSQVLANLVSNALKFTSVGGVTVQVERSSAGLAFTIADTGIGIAPEHHERVFLKFTQADSSTTRHFGGTGLGLAICRDLVGLMGGGLTMESTLGAGSTFKFELPLPRANSPEPQPVPAPEQPVDLGRLRTLAAEDNLTNQRVLSALLAPLDPHLVFAADGREAVEAFQREPFDLVLMDAQMPEMSGAEAARAIRQLELEKRQPRTPIIALTANVMRHQLDTYFAAGMDGHVGKPIEARLLFAEIERMLADPALREVG